jgi:hypothetical protein
LNHNPDNALWSVTERKGFLRLGTGRIDSSFLLARNTLTQRTIGPVCSGSVSLDLSHMKDGDFSGLGLLQKNYGLAGAVDTDTATHPHLYDELVPGTFQYLKTAKISSLKKFELWIAIPTGSLAG